ncbi:MAG: hypothetical protein IMZ53_02870 [Thermoplasmata archaeon]|nr:hypothetical protein [Thermoplasmata archaeon]
MSAEEKSEHGRKTAAGMLLSKFIKQIAEEKTETGGETDNPVMISKAEALARLIWKCALGSIEEHTDDQGVVTKTYHAPDRTAWQLLFDRMEGKATSIGEADKTRGNVASRVSQQGKDRISDASGLGENSSSE